MEKVGGIVAEAIAIYLSNPDVMAILFGWGLMATILITVLEIWRG